MDSLSLHSPPGFDALELLAEHGSSTTTKGRLDGKDVVLRLSPAGTSSEALAELRILASVQHPGIASLVAHGMVARSGQQFVARSWIEGADFRTWSREHSADEICQAAAQLCPALTHLHAQGFLHSDLKPENVIVRPDGTPVLTDFGLSRALDSDDTDHVSGSWVSLAPELLLGQPATVQSDIFSFGVLLFLCLSDATPNPARLYARFPAVSFLEAAGESIESFPESIRDLLARCLARDPRTRPASFAEIERLLGGRLQLASARRPLRETAHWPLRRGREEWLETWIRGALQSASSKIPQSQRLLLPRGESATLFLDDLRLLASLAGLSSSSVDLSELVRGAATTAEVDRLLGDFLSRVETPCLFVTLSAPDHWSLSAQEFLLRSGNQSEPPVLIVTTGVISAPGDSANVAEEAWNEVPVPSADASLVRDFLAESFEFESEDQLAGIAKLLGEECEGAATLLDAALQCGVEQGWIVEGDSKPRLRSDANWDRAVLRAEEAPGTALSGFPGQVCAALAVGVGASSWAELQVRFAGNASDLPATLRELMREGLIAKRQLHQATLYELTRSGVAVKLEPKALREAHAREATRLKAIGANAARVLPHAWAAGKVAERALVAESRSLRDLGRAELALDMTREAVGHAKRIGRAVPLTLTGELASGWMSVGQYARAEQLLEAMSQAASDEERAVQALLAGQLATHKRQHESALEQFELAVTLDPAHAGAALMAKARLLYETRQDEALEELVDELSRGLPESLNQRLFANFRTMRAMSQHRRGAAHQAETTLSELYREAQDRGDSFHQAVLATNLASIARRRGDFGRALELFRKAEEAYENVGHLPGIAQARNLHGGVLREMGRLSEALLLLTSALEIRGRLGDRRGVTLTRGIIAMLHADAGELHTADIDLASCVMELEQMGSRVEAEFLGALKTRVRARLGRTDSCELAAETQQSDPRVLLALGWTAAHRGQDEEAEQRFGECVELATQLGWSGAAAEAEFALCVLTGGDPGAVSASSPAVLEDIRIHQLLTAELFDDSEARQLAGALEARGRLDRSARLWLALAQRCSDAEAKGNATRILARLSRGLTGNETARLRTNLLEVRDPCSTDLDTQFDKDESESVKDLETFLSINKRLAEQEDLKTLLGAIVESAIGVTGAARGFLILEEDSELRFDTALDSRRGDIDYPEMQTSRSVIHESLELMQPLRVRNAVEDPAWESAHSVQQLKLRSVMCAPFDVDESLRGVIYVDHPDISDLFEEKAEFLLSHLAGQASVAIRQVRRHGEIQRLNVALEEAIAETRSDLKTAREALRHAGLTVPNSGLVGSSAVMRRVHVMLERVAPSHLPVLITGSSGTGKEMAARALHTLSSRASATFVSENCASLPASLAESELFGFKKGAFTGADSDRAGMFERAHGGTLFLDEIGELALELQAKLLRVIETGELRRIGGNEPIHCDVRLIAATNRNIEQDLADGRFRSDLFYRLNAIRVELPLLAERVEDIPELVEHFVSRESARSGIERKVSRSVLRALCERDWPGNVRELANEVARLCLMSDGDLDDAGAVLRSNSGSAIALFGERMTLAMIERTAIEDAIERFDGDKKRAATYLGISRTKIYDCLARWKAEDAQ